MLLTQRSDIWKDKRFVLVVLLTGIVGVIFWGGSRYPALNDKALMGGETQLSALGFNVVMTVDEDAGLPMRLLANTVNWIDTNIKGMTFGIVFGALLMTLLPLLTTLQVQGRFANSVLGLLVGSPLGVCVNCVTPIAMGMRAAGGRVELMLATLFSSPTLNIIVLTMLFSLFPVYVGLIKIGLTLLFILVGVPLLTRFLPVPDAPLLAGRTNRLKPVGGYLAPQATYGVALGATTSWRQAIVTVGADLLRNLWYIIRISVPLMILAGFLGAALVTFVPFDSFATLIPKGGRIVIVTTMVVLAAVGLFLPVPMTFDLIITAVLLQLGMPIRYALVLLFTLGIFSIYPFMLLWRALGRTHVLALTVGLMGLGLLAGIGGHYGDRWQQAWQTRQLLAYPLSERPQMLRHTSQTQPQPLADLQPALQAQALGLTSVEVAAPDGLTIERSALTPLPTHDGPPFLRMQGDQLGIDPAYSLSILNFIQPFSQFRAIASGDVHGDGWPDLLLSSEQGLYLYANLGHAGFARQEINAPPALRDAFVANVALVDLNNDGGLDIFAATYAAGNYVLYNDGQGGFANSTAQPLPNQPGAIMTAAATFGDIDADGDLDIVLGNWSTGHLGRDPDIEFLSYVSSRNAWLENGPAGFTLHDLDGLNGETLTTLLTDFNNDGNQDLLVGNDFPAVPDYYYLGDGGGGWRMLTKADNIIPQSTTTTMSFATADINNDLRPEIYVAQISRNHDDWEHTNPETLCGEISGAAQHDCLTFFTARQPIVNSVTSRNVLRCLEVADAGLRRDCIGLHHLFSATRWDYDPEQCADVPDTWSEYRAACQQVFTETTDALAGRKSAIPQNGNSTSNILLMPTEGGRFVDQAAAMGVSHGDWSWNARFADYDQDGWQDLFIAAGWLAAVQDSHNLFYRNQAGQGFTEDAAAMGLDSRLPTSSYTSVDLDNDGDLDIVAIPAVGPIGVYLNNRPTGNAIAFELRDAGPGNHFGIGSKVIIHYGDGLSQMREIQAGGGFLSFDPAVAHFGLGTSGQVDSVEVVWSTGERTVIDAPLAAGSRYRLTR